MQTAVQQPYATPYVPSSQGPSIWIRFFIWCENQEEFRFLWLGIAVAGHACFLTPLTLFIIIFTGNSLFLWAFAIAAMGIALVTNLAALPTKITIPTFLFSIFIDLALIVISLSI